MRDHGNGSDGAGRPVEGAFVGVYGPAHPASSAEVQSTLTDAKGRYLLRVPSGDQRVYLADGRYEGISDNVSVADGSTTSLET